MSSAGEQAEHSSFWAPSISADGRFVSFMTGSRLVPGESYGANIFVRDRTGPCSFPALATSYGAGWPGLNGVPDLVATSRPVLCGTAEIFASNSSGGESVGVLLAGFATANLPTAFGGTVLIKPMLATAVRLPSDGLSATAGVPCDDWLCELPLFVQIVEMDGGASRSVSFTPGLELRFGTP